MPQTYIYNKSYQEGGFPDNMKISTVIPILKSGQNSILSNYRPISLLSQFSKIFEKLFERMLSCFLEKTWSWIIVSMASGKTDKIYHL